MLKLSWDSKTEEKTAQSPNCQRNCCFLKNDLLFAIQFTMSRLIEKDGIWRIKGSYLVFRKFKRMWTVKNWISLHGIVVCDDDDRKDDDDDGNNKIWFFDTQTHFFLPLH